MTMGYRFSPLCCSRRRIINQSDSSMSLHRSYPWGFTRTSSTREQALSPANKSVGFPSYATACLVNVRTWYHDSGSTYSQIQQHRAKPRGKPAKQWLAHLTLQADTAVKKIKSTNGGAHNNGAGVSHPGPSHGLRPRDIILLPVQNKMRQLERPPSPVYPLLYHLSPSLSPFGDKSIQRTPREVLQD